MDFLLHFDRSAVYPDEYRYRVTESGLSKRLCGAHRPGHFDGVLTVVLKLLFLVRASRAYFGEKDYQQLRLVQGLAEAFFLDTVIVPCPTVREPDGLAYSSRNRNLTRGQREKARFFPDLLGKNFEIETIRERLRSLGIQVEYIEEFEGRRLGAVRIGSTRLIDNFPIPSDNL